MTIKGEFEAGAHAPASPVPAEEWREIPGYDGWYEASSLGRIRSWSRGGRRGGRLAEPRPMRLTGGKKGYLQVGLKAGPGKVTRYVSHLVAEAFIGPRPEGTVTCHNNGDNQDNRAVNLRYDTPTGNEADKEQHGTRLRGEDSPASTLTEAEVREIHAATGSHRSIGDKYGVSQSEVTNIKNGRIWKHLGLTPIHSGLPSRPGELSHRSKLCDRVVMAMREGRMTAREAADECGTNIHAAWKAKVGMTWKHLPMLDGGEEIANDPAREKS
ncbi:hypothetical protein GCM10009700_35030 [Brevibacterium sanguinis]|uniref:NUMOD4 motif-containing HNH endonuclease n=1 Tax=Brevibacterium sanguinis TaxID=232444 RepID=UPI00337B824A